MLSERTSSNCGSLRGPEIENAPLTSKLVCVCVCVSVWEREREREREKQSARASVGSVLQRDLRKRREARVHLWLHLIVVGVKPLPSRDFFGFFPNGCNGRRYLGSVEQSTTFPKHEIPQQHRNFLPHDVERVNFFFIGE